MTSSRRAVAGAVCVGASMAALVATVTPAWAATVTYSNQKTPESTWIVSGYRKSHQNTALSSFGAGNATASNGVFSSTGTPGITISYKSGYYDTKCKWSSPSVSGQSLNLKCWIVS